MTDDKRNAAEHDPAKEEDMANAAADLLDDAADKLDDLVTAAESDTASAMLKRRKDRIAQLAGEARDVKRRVGGIADDLAE